MTRILKTPFRSRSGVPNSRFLNLAKFVHLLLTSKNLETPWIPTLNHHQLQMEYTHWFGSMKPSGRFRQDISMGTPKIWKKNMARSGSGRGFQINGKSSTKCWNTSEMQVTFSWISETYLNKSLIQPVEFWRKS